MEQTVWELLGFEEIEPGGIQSAGGMTVLELFGMVRPREYGAGAGVTCRQDGGYGRVALANSERFPVVVPSGAMTVAGKRAQDHAVVYPVAVPPGGEVALKEAACVQPGVSGHIKDGSPIVRMLPVGIRGMAWRPDEKEKEGYAKLWAGIERWTGAHDGKGVPGYLQRHENELEEFVAEFEPVPDQIGAAIFLGGELWGMEIFPSPEAWLFWWRAILRDGYGAQLIMMRQQEVEIAGPKLPELAGGAFDMLGAWRRWRAEQQQVFAGKMTMQVDDAGEPERLADGYTKEFAWRVQTLRIAGYSADVLLDTDGPVYAGVVKVQEV